VAICCLSLDGLGVIELRPHNRYKFRGAKTLRWRPQGPVMTFFRERVMADFFADGLDGEGEFGAGHARVTRTPSAPSR
jgi:hypothetical protein